MESGGLGWKGGEWLKKGKKGDIRGMNGGEGCVSVRKEGGKVDGIRG